MSFSYMHVLQVGSECYKEQRFQSTIQIVTGGRATGPYSIFDCNRRLGVGISNKVTEISCDSHQSIVCVAPMA